MRNYTRKYYHVYFLDATANGVKQEIQCLKEDLEAVLNEAVSITEEKPLHLLLDLHYQLSRILKQYIRTCDRKKLPNVSIIK